MLRPYIAELMDPGDCSDFINLENKQKIYKNYFINKPKMSSQE